MSGGLGNNPKKKGRAITGGGGGAVTSEDNKILKSFRINEPLNYRLFDFVSDKKKGGEKKYSEAEAIRSALEVFLAKEGY